MRERLRRGWNLELDSIREQLVLSAVGDGGMGKQAYRFTSAFIHTRPHAFSMFLPAHMQTDPQTPGVVPLGISVDDMTTWLMVATHALHTAAARCGHYFGWDLARWTKAVNTIMSKWADSLNV